MKARVKATGEIVEVREVTKYDSNYNPIVYYKTVDGFSHRKEQLDFKDLTQGKADVKEKSLHKDEPSYWDKLKHQYAGMAMQGILSCDDVKLDFTENTDEVIDAINIASVKIAKALINKLKEEENDNR